MSTTPPAHYRGKRALDLLIVAVLAIPAAALGAACALLVRVSSRGPALFRQRRAGWQGREFTLFKFRTMIHGDNPGFPDPSRITGVGKVLRRTSLDELPQLLNVVRGDMSIVGPRPTLPYQVERYDARQRGRLAVRPGVTGLAQVSGRNAMAWAERIELDLSYVAQQSAWLDLRILGRSFTTVFRGEGVEGHPVDDPIAAQTPTAQEPSRD